MKRKIRIVFWVCTAAVVISTLWSLVRTLRPSRGKPYERVSVEEACDYMSYETSYCIVDVRDEEDYAAGHVEGAKNLPRSEIVARAEDVLPDRTMMVYLYGQDEEDSCQAAQKLSNLGYSSITETGGYQDWVDFQNNFGDET